MLVFVTQQVVSVLEEIYYINSPISKKGNKKKDKQSTKHLFKTNPFSKF